MKIIVVILCAAVTLRSIVIRLAGSQLMLNAFGVVVGVLVLVEVAVVVKMLPYQVCNCCVEPVSRISASYEEQSC